MATYGLIPGAGGDDWYWHRVVPELAARGHDVVAVALPAADESAGWAEYADAMVAAIGNRTRLVLVAQSLAGFSAPLVCARRPVPVDDAHEPAVASHCLARCPDARPGRTRRPALPGSIPAACRPASA
jgi:pimeloyl-ACP methyl ester carboxylesterase